MRFVLDMNLSPTWAEYLTANGHDATHWISIGQPDDPDRVILEYAATHDAVILTQDLDFGTLLALGGYTTPSVIQFRAQAVLPTDIGRELLAAIKAARGHLHSGALVTVDPIGHRATILPIRRDHDSP